VFYENSEIHTNVDRDGVFGIDVTAENFGHKKWL
jgi:hypothetical protein